MWYRFKPYVSVAKRRAEAAREVSELKKKGQDIQPVVIEGRKIATTFWGQSWCKNLEAYSDFSNRLPRGRTYVCNGSVVDLQIKPGKVTALVSGSSLYRIEIEIGKLPEPTWKSIRAACAGQIGSIVELLQGRLSKHVMEIVTQPRGGLFPKPGEIAMKCSCPDWAGLCKHLAAVLYSVGARLDHRPELLFLLRQVDHLELVEQAVEADSSRASSRASKKTIAAGDLADVFGIDIGSASAADVIAEPQALRKPRRRSESPKIKHARGTTPPSRKTVAAARGPARRSKSPTTELVAVEMPAEREIAVRRVGKASPAKSGTAKSGSAKRKSAVKPKLPAPSDRAGKVPGAASGRAAKNTELATAVAILRAKRNSDPPAAPAADSAKPRSRRAK